MQYPRGIVASPTETLFIADANGSVYKIASGYLTQLAGGITMGAPAGIALTPDNNTLAVSSLNNANGSAQVQLINLLTSELSIFNKKIDANRHPGGLHASRNTMGATGRYAWAGVTGPARVYRLVP
jgi:DNA-binding beta-propeller fold protein YncE